MVSARLKTAAWLVAAVAIFTACPANGSRRRNSADQEAEMIKRKKYAGYVNALCPPVKRGTHDFDVLDPAYAPGGGCIATSPVTDAPVTLGFEVWMGNLGSCDNIGKISMDYYQYDCVSKWIEPSEDGSRNWTFVMLKDMVAAQALEEDAFRCSVYDSTIKRSKYDTGSTSFRLAISENIECEGLIQTLEISRLASFDKSYGKDGTQILMLPKETVQLVREPRDVSPVDTTNGMRAGATGDGCRFPDWMQGMWSDLHVDGGVLRYARVDGIEESVLEADAETEVRDYKVMNKRSLRSPVVVEQAKSIKKRTVDIYKIYGRPWEPCLKESDYDIMSYDPDCYFVKRALAKTTTTTTTTTTTSTTTQRPYRLTGDRIMDPAERYNRYNDPFNPINPSNEFEHRWRRDVVNSEPKRRPVEDDVEKLRRIRGTNQEQIINNFQWRCVVPVNSGDVKAETDQFLVFGGRSNTGHIQMTKGSNDENVTDVKDDRTSSYACLRVQNHGVNVMEFTVIGAGKYTKQEGSPNGLASKLCGKKKDEKKRQRKWIAVVRKPETERRPVSCPVLPCMVFVGKVPAPTMPTETPGDLANAPTQLCAKLVSRAYDCDSGESGPGDRMRFTISECVDQDLPGAPPKILDSEPNEATRARTATDRQGGSPRRNRRDAADPDPSPHGPPPSAPYESAETAASGGPSSSPGPATRPTETGITTGSDRKTSASTAVFTVGPTDAPTDAPIDAPTDNPTAGPTATTTTTTTTAAATAAAAAAAVITPTVRQPVSSSPYATATDRPTPGGSQNGNNHYHHADDYDYYRQTRPHYYPPPPPPPPGSSSADYDYYYRQRQQQWLQLQHRQQQQQRQWPQQPDHQWPQQPDHQWPQQPDHQWPQQPDHQWPQQQTSGGRRTDDHHHRRQQDQDYSLYYRQQQQQQQQTGSPPGRRNASLAPPPDGWSVQGAGALYVSSGAGAGDGRSQPPRDDGADGWSTAAQQHWWYQQQQQQQQLQQQQQQQQQQWHQQRQWQHDRRGATGILSLPPVPLPPSHADQAPVTVSTGAPPPPPWQPRTPLKPPTPPPTPRGPHRPSDHYYVPTAATRTDYPPYRARPEPESGPYYRDKEYQCLGMWNEVQDRADVDGKPITFTYVYTKRLNPQVPGAEEYDCFVGTTIPNDPGMNDFNTTTLMMTTATVGSGTDCNRLQDPFSSGMKLVGMTVKNPGGRRAPSAASGSSSSSSSIGGTWYPLKPQQIPQPSVGAGAPEPSAAGGKWYAGAPVPVAAPGPQPPARPPTLTGRQTGGNGNRRHQNNGNRRTPSGANSSVYVSVPIILFITIILVAAGI